METKILKITLKMITGLFVCYVGFWADFIIATGCSQEKVNCKQSPESQTEKFWISNSQLKLIALKAKLCKEVFLRHYINGLEFTQRGYKVQYNYSDIICVAHVQPGERLDTTCAVGNPDDVINQCDDCPYALRTYFLKPIK